MFVVFSNTIFKINSQYSVLLLTSFDPVLEYFTLRCGGCLLYEAIATHGCITRIGMRFQLGKLLSKKNDCKNNKLYFTSKK